MSKKKVHFKTNVLLKSIIGRDLINNDNIAVLELVKNAYDAGSSKVKISFENLVFEDKEQEAKPKLIIQDWGFGMGEADVIDKWLNIAYSEKKSDIETHGRIPAGAKGIGRFSCDRLGGHLDMITKRSTDKNYYHLRINWLDFEIEDKPDLEIQRIPIELNSVSSEKLNEFNLEPFKNGTVLIISDLRSKWYVEQKEKIIPEQIAKLRKYLERLINPNQQVSKLKKFVVELYVPEFNDTYKIKDELIKVNGPIQNKIFQKLDFKTTSLESRLEISKSSKLLYTTLKDKGRDIFKLEEDVSNDKDFEVFEEDAFLVIYFLNTYSKSYFTKQTGVRSIDFGSIFLFRNGFRIPPYGDVGDDWLGLEVRKGQGQRRFLGTRDLVGRIELTDKKKVFKEVTSREGLVQDLAFNNLRNGFFYPALRMLEKYVVDGLKWDSIPSDLQRQINNDSTVFQEEIFQLTKEQKDQFALEAVRSIVRTHKNKVLSLDVNSDLIQTLAAEEKERFDEIFDEFENLGSNRIGNELKSSLLEIREVVRKKDNEIQRLLEKQIDVDSEDLFSREENEKDNREVEALQHHIHQASQRIHHYVGRIRRMIQDGANSEQVVKYLDQISFENKKIETISRFVTKANFNMLTTILEQDLVKFIKEYVGNVYSKYDYRILNNDKVQVRLFMKQNFEFLIKFRPIDIVVIIDNILDNSAKAKAKSASITIEKLGARKIRIIFKDDGIGIKNSIQDPYSIFDYGVTYTENGTGIGLYHVKSVVDKMKGNIEIGDTIKGFELIITIEK